MNSVKWDSLSESEQLRVAHDELNNMRSQIINSGVTITGTLLKHQEELVLAKLERGTFFLNIDGRVSFYL